MRLNVIDSWWDELCQTPHHLLLTNFHHLLMLGGKESKYWWGNPKKASPQNPKTHWNKSKQIATIRLLILTTRWLLRGDVTSVWPHVSDSLAESPQVKHMINVDGHLGSTCVFDSRWCVDIFHLGLSWGVYGFAFDNKVSTWWVNKLSEMLPSLLNQCCVFSCYFSVYVLLVEL